MIYVSTFFYYALFSSVVLFYGMGLNQISLLGEERLHPVIFYFKSLLSIFSTAVLTYLVVNFILVPLELIEIFPFISLLIFIAINSFAEGLVRLTTGTSTTEFVISFLIVLISIFQCSTILDTLVICFSCVCGIFLVVPFIHVFRKRIAINGKVHYEKFLCLFFVFLAILIMLISAFDISWLNGGVIK